jgi:GTP-binding protein
MFVDEATVTLIGGDGGDGCSSFRREKFVPRGGPDGGNGGRGGSVILVADRSRSTLLQFRHHERFVAERGRHGQGSDKTGRSGEDREIQVPVGTVVLDADGTRSLADLTEAGQRFVAATGGRGGRGNASFSSSVQRAPTRRERGQPGERVTLRLELKLLADVGLVGFPNAGKSTLLSVVSAAKPKIADYPFTTLEPHLGVVDRGDFRSFVVADIPGLIEGAHEGAGLGHRFLRHVERCRLLLHLVDPTDPERDPVEAVRNLDQELRLFRPELATRPQILVMTKLDAVQDSQTWETLRQLAERRGQRCLAISAVTGKGLPDLVSLIGQRLDAMPFETPECPAHDD